MRGAEVKPPAPVGSQGGLWCEGRVRSPLKVAVAASPPVERAGRPDREARCVEKAPAQGMVPWEWQPTLWGIDEESGVPIGACAAQGKGIFMVSVKLSRG